MNSNLTIAIIDSGIDTKLISENLNHNIKGIHIYKKQDTILFDENIKDEIGHGTGVYNTIKKHITENINFYIIKIFDSKTIAVDEDILIAALEYIYEYDNVNIINASLGISVLQNSKKLKDICTKISASGTLLVSAFDNNGSVAFPAAFDNVIGVTSGESIYNCNEYDFVDNSVVNICAFGNPQRIKWLNDRIIVMGGDSFACAHISGIIAKLILGKSYSYKEVLLKLKLNARNNSSDENNNANIDIKKAVVFPFSKEMHALIRFQELLPFEIVDVYDVPRSGRIGSSTSSLLQIQDNGYIIKSILNLDYSSFDTFILGHTYELSTANFKFNIAELIKSLDGNDKKIYSFDDLDIMYPGLFENKLTRRIYTPKIVLNESHNVPFGKLYNYSKPILGIFGTSSKQGKFSLQLILRDYFIKNGYSIGQIGSEPSAYLFNMDYCIPFGQDSTLDLTGKQMIQHLNKIIHELCEKPVDLIMCGSQSGTITNDFGNIDNYPINQIFYLLSVNPDAVILCVNPFDSIMQIKRSIEFIESCTESRVIALCMYPMDWNNPEQGIFSTYSKIDPRKFLKIKNDLERRFEVPVFLLGEEPDMEMLYEHVVDFFSDQ